MGWKAIPCLPLPFIHLILEVYLSRQILTVWASILVRRKLWRRRRLAAAAPAAACVKYLWRRRRLFKRCLFSNSTSSWLAAEASYV